MCLTTLCPSQIFDGSDPLSANSSSISVIQVSVLTSEDILKAVRLRLRNSFDAEMRSVECDLHQGDLLLRGQVSSYVQKQLVQELVRPVAGNLTIVNSVNVITFYRN